MLETFFLVLLLAAALYGAIRFQLRSHRPPAGDGSAGPAGCGPACPSCPIGGECIAARTGPGSETPGDSEKGVHHHDNGTHRHPERE